MTQKIWIYVINKADKVRAVRILRKNLKRYIKTEWVTDPYNKPVWAKPDIYRYLRKKLSKEASKRAKQKAKDTFKKPKRVKRFSGKTDLDGRSWTRFEFPLWRRKITEDRIEELMQKLWTLFLSVEGEVPRLNIQRLGLSITSEVRRKLEKDRQSKLIDRTYTRAVEAEDFISTISYRRNKTSTIEMFNELRGKIWKYLKNQLDSPSLHEEEETKEGKRFYVFFIEE